jgi:hypothetical protein
MNRFRTSGWGIALGLASTIAISTPRSARASSHAEAPLISQDPAVDNADVYFFVDPNRPDQAVLLATFNGLSNPASGPNYKSFADGAWYDFKIDNDGDGVEDVTYRFIFSTTIRDGENTFLYNTGPFTMPNDPNLNVVQTYLIQKITGHAANPDQSQITIVGGGVGNPFYTAPWNVGPKSNPNNAYHMPARTIFSTSDGGIVQAGPRADPFFVDLGMIFDLVNLEVPGAPLASPGRSGVGVGNQGGGKNTLNGFNVMAIMLEVPISNLTRNHDLPTDATSADAVVGLWSTTSRPRTRVLNTDGTVTSSSDYAQVSRLGNPLINEVAIALGDKDKWNATEPKDDLANFGHYALDPILPKYYKALFGIDSPPAPRVDVVQALFTGIPGLNTRPNEVVADEVRLNVAIPPVPIGEAKSLGILDGDTAGFPNGRRTCDDVVDIELRVLAGGTPLTPDFNHAPNNLLGDGVDTPDPACSPAFPFMITPYEAFADQHAGNPRPVHAADARPQARMARP